MMTSEQWNYYPEKPQKLYNDCAIHGNNEALINGKCKECVRVQNELENKQIIEKRISNAKKDANVYELFTSSTFDNYVINSDDKEYATRLTKFINSLRELKFNNTHNILMIGSAGTGKTHIANAIIDTAVRKGKSAYYEVYSRLADMKIRNYSNYIKLEKVDVLVIDEYGRLDSDFTGGLLFDLINYRYSNNKTTVVISNLQGEEIKSKMDASMYGRLKEYGSGFNFTHNDYRLRSK